MARIAVVDDSRMARAFAVGALAKAGHEAFEVEPTSLSEVMASLRTLRPDLILLDHMMPAFSGPSLVRACFEDSELGSVRVVMLSAHRMEDLEHRMAKLGVHAVLHKPVAPGELASGVAKALEHPSRD